MRHVLLKLFFLSVLALSFNSCYPPRIIYSLDNNLKSIEDSLDITLIKCYAHASGGTKYHIVIDFEFTNNSSSDITIAVKELSSFIDDSLTSYSQNKIGKYIIQPSETNELSFFFSAIDTELLSYSLEKKTRKSHRLCLVLHISDCFKDKDFSLIFNPVKISRLNF